MKVKSFLFINLLCCFLQQATAQAPQKMSYQSVIRNSSNVLLANTQVGIRISVLQGNETGPAVYVETQTANTNGNGLLSIKIGMGTATTGTFAGINWANASYFIKTETDPTGGSNYTITGTQEVLSVPYAIYAGKSVNDSAQTAAITALQTQVPAFLPTIVIGKQQWMKENLDVVTYRNGDIIPQVTDPTAWAALTTGAWCYYNNDPANGAIYGKLYNWYAVNDSRGLAPQGWHIPTDAEWDTLGAKLGGDPVAGGKMKTTGTTPWISPNTGATNESGFAGLPGGNRRRNGPFEYVGNYGIWWSATEYSSTITFCSTLLYNDGRLGRNFDYKTFGFSVRCLRD
jgi:uncharacterized protein (TIGR02145 family)